VSSSEFIDKLLYALVCEYSSQYSLVFLFFFFNSSRFHSQPDLSNTSFIINRFKFKSLLFF